MDTLVISGASRGIGLATAQLFADAGWRVINVSRRPAPLAGVLHAPVDLGRRDWRAHHAESLRELVRGSTRIALVHCAGMLTKDSLRDLEADTLHDALQVNVVAALELDQVLLPLMPSGSSIVYVGSTLGEKAVAGACAYVVSKHALIGLMRSTCQDLVGSGIHTACVCPGFTDTEMLRAHVGESAEVLQALGSGIAYGRLIQPQEIAAVIRFCVLNAVVNGAVIHANLGQIEH